MPASSSLPLREVSAFLLSIHTHGLGRSHRDNQRFTLDELGKLVPFDVAVLGTGTIQNGVTATHDSLVHGLPAEFMESWMRVSAEDRVIVEAMKTPGRTVTHDGRTSSLYGDAAGEHARRWGIVHVLSNAQVYVDSGLYWVIGLARRDAERPFDELEGESIALVAPHLVAVHRRARLEHLRATLRRGDDHAHAVALINPKGLLLEAERTLADLLKRAWPSWTGPWLPREVRDAIGDENVMRPEQGRIVLRFSAAENGYLLHVREAQAGDLLTDRERQIALAFSRGDTARQVALAFGVAPNTIRRHLANIYEKLGISSKTEIRRMLGDP
jgi:DNA-binding CsgD family transcriptional regulator